MLSKILRPQKNTFFYGFAAMMLLLNAWTAGADRTVRKGVRSGPCSNAGQLAVQVSADQIRSAVQAYIDRQAPWAPDRMKIRPIQYRQNHCVPIGRLSIDVTRPKHADWVGALPLKVTLSVDGREIQKTSVAVYIEVWQEVVVAAKPLGRAQPIAPEDLRIERMNLARVPANALLQMDQALGRRANRSIAMNTVLRSDQVDVPPAIRKGALVQVLAESNAFKICALGVAQEDRGVGEPIRVMNVTSKKNIHARVVDAQTVRVDF